MDSTFTNGDLEIFLTTPQTILYTDIAYLKSFSYHRKHYRFFKVELFFSYYALFLIIVGTIFNLTSFLVMIRKNMRKYACMRYLAILSIVDLLVLYQWNLNTFYKYNFSFPPFYRDLEELSLFWCRWISYLAFSTLQLSSWLLSIVSIDRVMVVYCTCWNKYMHKPNRINLVIILIILIIFMSNVHIVLYNGYTEHFNSTQTDILSSDSNQTVQLQKVVCYRSKSDSKYIFPKWEKVHLLIYNAIPFGIMLVCNSMIIYNVKFARRVQSQTKSSAKKKRRMTLMLVLITFTFMILTLPSVITHTFLREFLINKTYRRMVNIIVNSLLHTSHAINFLLYVYSAPNFRAEIIRIVKGYKKKILRTEQSVRSTRKATVMKNSSSDSSIRKNDFNARKSANKESVPILSENELNRDKENKKESATQFKDEDI